MRSFLLPLPFFSVQGISVKANSSFFLLSGKQGEILAHVWV